MAGRSIVIRPLDSDSDAVACDAIIASLPGWFGMEEGIRECAAAVRTQPGLVAEIGGSVAGFLTLARPYPSTPEISWLAVHARHRRRGMGRALIEAVSDQLRAEGDRIVVVKTLSDRTDPGPEYAETRAFYLAFGFVPVVETRSLPRQPDPAAGAPSLTDHFRRSSDPAGTSRDGPAVPGTFTRPRGGSP